MELNYTISKKDFIQSQRAHLGNALVIGVPVIGIIIVIAVAADAIATQSFSARTVFVLLWGAFLIAGIPWSWGRAYLADKRLHQQIRAVITPTEILLKQPNNSGRLSWNSFIRWRETNDTILLYQGPRLFNVFPKRAFSESQLEEFRQLIRDNVHEVPKPFLSSAKIVLIVSVCAALALLIVTVLRAR